jgi:hypothetical protein
MGANLSPQTLFSAPGGEPAADWSTAGGTRARLAAEFQTFEELLVTLRRGLGEVIEQLAALGDELEQAAARRMVFFVTGQVTGQVSDAVGEHRDLNVRAAGVTFVKLIRFDIVGLAHKCSSGWILPRRLAETLAMLIRSRPHLSGRALRREWRGGQGDFWLRTSSQLDHPLAAGQLGDHCRPRLGQGLQQGTRPAISQPHPDQAARLTWAMSEQKKILVFTHHNSVFLGRFEPKLAVVGLSLAAVQNMLGLVTLLAQPIGHGSWELVIDEKFHAAVAMTA